MQTYKYDAFISYRHTEPDKTIAEKLHRMLETFRVPRAVIKMGSQKKVGRIFRDCEELPTSSNLADSIQQALENSEHLIVICSPRTPHSQWVCKEIETFAALHGHERILALLIEGEPEESFPEQLCFVKKCIHHSDGTATEEFQEVEPLAADIRAQSLSGMKKKLKTEILRLLAPILNCRFDDLKQRHRERKVKRILTLSFALSFFFLLFGSYSAYQASLIKQQAEVIQQKSEQVEQHAEMLEIQVQKTLRGQSLYLSDIAENYLSNGDRLGAVLAAKEALPKNLANPERPYVEEAEYILCEALGVYKTHYVFELRADLLLRHNEKVLDTALSPDGKKVATLTDASAIYFWNAENGMLLNTCDLHQFLYGSDLHFLDESNLLFYTDKGVHCLDTDTMNEKWSYSCRGSDLAVSRDLSKAALIYSDLVVLDTSTGQPIMDVPLKDILPGIQYPHGSNIVFDESGGCLFFSIDDGAIVKMDLEKKEVAQVFSAAYGYVTGFAVSPDGRVAVISFESEANKPYCLNVFDASGDTLYSITSNDSIEDPSFVPTDSDQLIYTSYEDLIILNIRDRTQHICMHGDIVTDYYVFEDLIVTTSYNGSIRFWDAEGSEYTLLRMNLGIYISTLDFVPGIFALKSENDVVLLRPFENNNAILLEGHSELYIEYMIYLEDSRHLVSCSDFGEIILWDLEKKEAIKTIHTQERIKSIYSVDHGRRIMVFSDDSTISVYDSATLSLIRTATFVEVYKHVLSPDHSLCYLMGWEEDRIIDTSNLETVMAVPGTIGSEVVFLNDNSRAILKNNNGLSILDIPGKAITKEREIEAYELTGFRLSHDSNTLACISDDHSIKLFDANSLEERLNIDCPGPSPEAVFFDPSDKTLFISFSDQSIGRYSAVDGTLIGMLEKKVEVLTDLLFSQERNIYITKGLTEAYIWNSDTHKPIGHIPILRTADLKSGYLFTAYFEKLYALPLYDTQMLLDEAERQLQGRTLTPEEKKRLFIVE